MKEDEKQRNGNSSFASHSESHCDSEKKPTMGEVENPALQVIVLVSYHFRRLIAHVLGRLCSHVDRRP